MVDTPLLVEHDAEVADIEANLALVALEDTGDFLAEAQVDLVDPGCTITVAACVGTLAITQIVVALDVFPERVLQLLRGTGHEADFTLARNIGQVGDEAIAVRIVAEAPAVRCTRMTVIERTDAGCIVAKEAVLPGQRCDHALGHRVARRAGGVFVRIYPNGIAVG